MARIVVGFITFICFLLAVAQAKPKREPKTCKSRFTVTQSFNNEIPVVVEDNPRPNTDDTFSFDDAKPFPSVISWYIGSYLDGKFPSEGCATSFPAIAGASCVLEGQSFTFVDDEPSSSHSDNDPFANELLDDQFPAVFNCDGTILINQAPNGQKNIDSDCYGNKYRIILLK